MKHPSGMGIDRQPPSQLAYDVSGINHAPMFHYLEAQGKDSSLICRRTGLSKAFLTDRREFIDLRTSLKIFAIVKELLAEPDPAVFYEIGKTSAHSRSLGVVDAIGRHLGGPKHAVAFIPNFNRKFNSLFNMTVCNLRQHTAVVLIDYHKSDYERLWTYDQCFWNKGNIASIPTAWDLPCMTIEEPLCRFSLADVFKAYRYLKPKFNQTFYKAYLNGREIAIRVALGREYLQASTGPFNPNPSHLPRSQRIAVYTNRSYRPVGPQTKTRLPETPHGMMILRDTCISDRLTLKAGQIFGAPYCRLNLRWQNPTGMRHKWIKRWFQNGRPSVRLLQHLEEELEANKAHKAQLIGSQAALQRAHSKLARYTDQLEHLVRQRTHQLHQEKAKVVKAQQRLARFLAPQIVDKIVSGDVRAVKGYCRRKLTLFFSDIKNFTQVAEAMEPEDLARLVNAYFSNMYIYIQRYQGTLASVMGDGLFVFFGAPETTHDRDHALRCVNMAIDMQRQMRALQSHWFKTGIEHPLQIRCGINTGIATVGSYGSHERKEYTAMGLHVNLAARLETLCRPGEILISHATWALVKQRIKTRRLGYIKVKGLQRPLLTHQVIFNRH
jgi:class 3 adenylate cyclase